MALRLTEDHLRRAHVRAQLLDGAAPGRDVAETVAAVVGIQAQEPREAALSIRARGAGLVAAHVDDALATARSTVLTWSLRGTRHYHHQADVRWLVGLLGPVFSRPSRRAERLGIAGALGERAVQAVRDALATDGPLTRRELAERLASRGVDPSGQAPIHVIRRAALEGILCVVPAATANGKERYTLLDDWLAPGPPGPPPLGPEEARAELARRYLAAYGPAGPSDFATWSGLGLPAARAAWATVAGELAPVEGPSGRVWALASQLPAALEEPAPLRLLGGFDTLLLGYADKDLHLAPEYRRRVNAGGGIVRPTVVADGRVVGTWARGQKGLAALLDVVPFQPLSGCERSDLDREAADVGRFLGTDPALTVADA